MFELVESGGKATLTMNISKLVVPGSIQVDGNITVTGLLKADNVDTNGIDIAGQFKLGKAAGTAAIAAGASSVVVTNTQVSAGSQILLTSNQFVSYRVTSKVAGSGFTIELSAPAEANVSFDYLVIN